MLQLINTYPLQDHAGDESRDDLELMDEGLEDETERIERRESRRDEVRREGWSRCAGLEEARDSWRD